MPAVNPGNIVGEIVYWTLERRRIGDALAKCGKVVPRLVGVADFPQALTNEPIAKIVNEIGRDYRGIPRKILICATPKLKITLAKRSRANRTLSALRKDSARTRVYHFSPARNLTHTRVDGIGDRRERNCPILHNVGAIASSDSPQGK